MATRFLLVSFIIVRITNFITIFINPFGKIQNWSKWHTTVVLKNSWLFWFIDKIQYHLTVNKTKLKHILTNIVNILCEFVCCWRFNVIKYLHNYWIMLKKNHNLKLRLIISLLIHLILFKKKKRYYWIH